MSVRTNAGFLDSVPIGAGMEWFTNTPPENWMLQNGAEISREEYSELFALIGTTFGAGNGTTTFNLPNKMGRTGVGKADSRTFNTLGKTVGAETVKLAASNIPSVNVSIPGGLFNETGGRPYHLNDRNRFAAGPNLTVGGGNDGNFNLTVKTNNGTTAVNNVQPSLVQNYIIKVK